MKLLKCVVAPFNWLSDMFGRAFPEQPPAYIRLSDAGFEIVQGDKVCFQGDWDDIEYITAFKADLFTIDQIRLVFEFRSGKEYVLTEDIGGYKGFIDSMNGILGIDPEWIGRVTHPPFAENRAVIYANSEENQATQKRKENPGGQH